MARGPCRAETPVVFDGTDQVVLRYLQGTNACSVSIKDLGSGAIGNKADSGHV